MSEELNAIPGEVPPNTEEPQTQEHVQTQVDPFESQAREQGWVPKEEWTGEEHLWRPAKEFVERGELFNTIHELRSENKKIREALSFLNDHHKKVKETEFNRALSVLKDEKKKALEEGDADKLLQVEDAMDLVKQQRANQQAQESQQSAKQSGPTEVFLAWKGKNGWYQKDKEMTDFADEVGLGYFQRNPGCTETQVYDYVAKRVKQAFSDKFKGTAPKTPAVEGATGTRVASQSNDDRFELSDDEKRVMNTFVRQGIMTKEQYIAELKKVKGA